MARAWHHLPLSAVAVLWNLILVGDYLGLKLGVDVYVGGFTAEHLAWFEAMPAWLNVAWGIAVWTGLLGAVLLAARTATGVFFALSFAGWAAMLVGLMWFRDPPVTEVSGTAGLYMLVAATAVAFVFFLYTRWMHARWRKLRTT